MDISDIKSVVEQEDLKGLEALGFTEPKRALSDLKLLMDSPFGSSSELLAKLAKNVLASPSPTQALNNLERISESTPTETLQRILKIDHAAGYLTMLAGSSELLTGSICRHPTLLEPLFIGGEAEIDKNKDFEIFLSELNTRIDLLGDEAKSSLLASTLRIYKQREYVRIGLRDLLSMATLEEVTAEIADLASATLEVAVNSALKELRSRFGRPLYKSGSGKVLEAGFTVIGMGKLGGRELNFSSDIDLIYLYTTEAGESAGVDGKAGTKIGLHEYFVKCAEKVTRLINEITDEGNVFRVDLDLRPEGRSGEITNSLSSIETYYEAWGRTWERSAMIKARPVAGDVVLGEGFLQMITPFVYRKYLDFRAIDELKGMKEKLDIDLLKRKSGTIDVKLGIGGIREIEFFCQALLLINGGKNVNIREKNTLLTIDKLVENSLLAIAEATLLKESYRFLRRVEHRIQIIEGRQTHALPVAGKEAGRIARMVSDEYKNVKDFIEAYKTVTGEVYGLYRSLFYKSTKELEESIDPAVLLLFSSKLTDEEGIERLGKLGFSDCDAALVTLKTLRNGPVGVRLPATTRTMLEKLSPFLLTRTLLAPDPDSALKFLNSFISAMGAHATFYALLSENPKVAELLITIFGTSDFLTNQLLAQPGAMDHLLSSDLLSPRKTKKEVEAELNESLEKVKLNTAFEIGERGSVITACYEELLDTIRRFKGGEVLRIGINDILGELDIEGVHTQFTSLAEITLDAAIKMATEELSARYGKPNKKEETNGAKFAVLGLGKLGSRELIYGSDLDIIFVYSTSAGDEGTTTGPKEISIHEYYIKLGQRIISILTLRTREGTVFPVDMRLRPSGSAGPLVLTDASLIKYQSERAEIWEAQAMIKARAVAGDIPFGEKIVKTLNETIYTRGLSGDELSEIRRIRERMENEIAKEGPGRYNIKTGRGGVVDIEFLTQILQMKFGAKVTALQTPSTLDALSALKAEGLITAEDYQVLTHAYLFFLKVTVKLRVVHDRAQGDIVKESKEIATLSRGLGYQENQIETSKDFINDYIELSRKVREIYTRVLDSLLVRT